MTYVIYSSTYDKIERNGIRWNILDLRWSLNWLITMFTDWKQQSSIYSYNFRSILNQLTVKYGESRFLHSL